MMMITLLNAFIERQKIPVNGDGRSHWPFPTLPLANCGCKKIASRVLKGDARLKGRLFSSSLARSRISMTSRRRGETDTRRKLDDMGQKNWGWNELYLKNWIVNFRRKIKSVYILVLEEEGGFSVQAQFSKNKKINLFFWPLNTPKRKKIALCKVLNQIIPLFSF